MVRIVLSAGWTHTGPNEFEGSEGPLPEVIKSFVAENPVFRHRLLSVEGELLPYFNVYLDEEFVPRGERATAPVGPSTTVTIVPPMAGG